VGINAGLSRARPAYHTGMPPWGYMHGGRVGIAYRGTSLIRNRLPLGPYGKPMTRALWWSQGGGCFLMSEVPLYRLLTLIDFHGECYARSKKGVYCR